MTAESRLTIDDKAKNAANAWYLATKDIAQTVAEAAGKAIKDGDADKPASVVHIRYLCDQWDFALEQLAQAQGKTVITPATHTLNVEVGNMGHQPTMTLRKRRIR
jgi:hypothetical protein